MGRGPVRRHPLHRRHRTATRSGRLSGDQSHPTRRHSAPTGLSRYPTEQVITQVPLNAGDQIFAEVFVANAGGSPNLAGSFGVFWLQVGDVSTSAYTPVG